MRVLHCHDMRGGYQQDANCYVENGRRVELCRECILRIIAFITGHRLICLFTFLTISSRFQYLFCVLMLDKYDCECECECKCECDCKCE